MVHVITFILNIVNESTSLMIFDYPDVCAAKYGLHETYNNSTNTILSNDVAHGIIDEYNMSACRNEEYLYTCFISDIDKNGLISLVDYDLCQCRSHFKQNIFSTDDYKRVVGLSVNDYFRFTLDSKKIYKILSCPYDGDVDITITCQEYYSGDEVQLKFDHKDIVITLSCS